MNDDPAPVSNNIPAPKSAAPEVHWLSVIGAAVLVLLAFRALVTVLFIIELQRYPFEYFINEATSLVYAQRLLDGDTIYTNSSAYPLLGNIYPPIYPWLTAFFGKFATLNLEHARLFILIPISGILAMIGLFLRRAGCRTGVIAGAILLVPCCYSVCGLLLMPRYDTWMVLFCLANLYLLDAPKLDAKHCILAGLFTALALFTKQTAIFGLAAVHVDLLMRDRRKGLLAGGAAAAFCVLLLAIFRALHGTAMIESMTTLSVHREFQWERIVSEYWPCIWPIGVLAVAAVARMAKNLRGRSWQLLDSYILGHALMSGLMLFKFSGWNYILPVFFGMLIAAARSASDLLNNTAWKSRAPFVLAALVALQLALQIPSEEIVTAPIGPEFVEGVKVAAFIALSDGPVFTDNFWGAVVERPATRQYFIEPTHVFTLPPGRLSPEVQVQPFKDRVFSRVVLDYYDPIQQVPGFAENYQAVESHTVKMCFNVPLRIQLLYYIRRENGATPAPAPNK